MNELATKCDTLAHGHSLSGCVSMPQSWIIDQVGPCCSVTAVALSSQSLSLQVSIWPFVSLSKLIASTLQLITEHRGTARQRERKERMKRKEKEFNLMCLWIEYKEVGWKNYEMINCANIKKRDTIDLRDRDSTAQPDSFFTLLQVIRHISSSLLTKYQRLSVFLFLLVQSGWVHSH